MVCLRLCMSRMAAVVALSAGAVEVEFPIFGMCQCWSVFDLALRRPADRDEGHDRFLASAEKRIARLFNVPMDKFRSEFMDHLPMARAAFTKGGMSCWEAWAEVWRRTQHKKQ